MEVECNKAWISHSPESCNSRMISPLFCPPFCPCCVFGIWFCGLTGGIVAFSQCHRECLLTHGHSRAQDGAGWRGAEGWEVEVVGSSPWPFSLPRTGCGISCSRWLLNSRGLMASSTPVPMCPHPRPRKKSSPFIVFGTHPYASPPPLKEVVGLPICVCSGYISFWKMHQCFPNGKSSAVVSKRSILGDRRRGECLS